MHRESMNLIVSDSSQTKPRLFTRILKGRYKLANRAAGVEGIAIVDVLIDDFASRHGGGVPRRRRRRSKQWPETVTQTVKAWNETVLVSVCLFIHCGGSNKTLICCETVPAALWELGWLRQQKMIPQEEPMFHVSRNEPILVNMTNLPLHKRKHFEHLLNWLVVQYTIVFWCRQRMVYLSVYLVDSNKTRGSNLERPANPHWL